MWRNMVYSNKDIRRLFEAKKYCLCTSFTFIKQAQNCIITQLKKQDYHNVDASQYPCLSRFKKKITPEGLMNSKQYKQCRFYVIFFHFLKYFYSDHSGPLTGASMNPARALGPAICATHEMSNAFDYHWIYWVGPLLGGACAAILHR